MTRQTKRHTLATFGRRPHTVRVFVERGGLLVRVQWREQGRLRTESKPNTPENRRALRSFAQGVAESLDAPNRARPRLRTGELFGRYAEAEFPALRPRTRALNADAWRKWVLAVGETVIAEDLGPDSMATLRAELERDGLAVRTIARVIRGIKVVYNWAEEHELIQRNRVSRYRYKVAKDKRPAKVAEYRQEEFAPLVGQLSLTSSRSWRAGAVLRVCGYQGVRQNAVLHLVPEDLDFAGGRIHWRPEWDKLGRDWWQPMRAPTREVLVQALAWRERLGYTGRWLFWAPRNGDKPFSAQSLWWSLTRAEQRAGIPHLPYRAAHGLRRMLAGDVLALTGNLKTAGDAIGDRDLQVLADSYLVGREDEVRSAFDRLDERLTTPETVTRTVTD